MSQLLGRRDFRFGSTAVFPGPPHFHSKEAPIAWRSTPVEPIDSMGPGHAAEVLVPRSVTDGIEDHVSDLLRAQPLGLGRKGKQGVDADGEIAKPLTLISALMEAKGAAA